MTAAGFDVIPSGCVESFPTVRLKPQTELLPFVDSHPFFALDSRAVLRRAEEII